MLTHALLLPILLPTAADLLRGSQTVLLFGLPWSFGVIAAGVVLTCFAWRNRRAVSDGLRRWLQVACGSLLPAYVVLEKLYGSSLTFLLAGPLVGALGTVLKKAADELPSASNGGMRARLALARASLPRRRSARRMPTQRDRGPGR